jgi:hypothetical protein
MLVEGVPDWPQDTHVTGTEGRTHFLIVPVGGDRVRLHLAWELPPSRPCRHRGATCLGLVCDRGTGQAATSNLLRRHVFSTSLKPRRGVMNRLAVIAATALSVAFATSAVAQVAIEIAPAQRTTIKEYVVKEKVKPVVVKEKMSVGYALPAEVTLNPVPTTWGPTLTKYNYVYHDNHVVLVEPSSRKVVQIID